MKFSNHLATYYYKYKTLSVDHLKDLQNDIDKLLNAGILSDHKTYRKYLGNVNFSIPENFPQAKSLVILAISTKLAYVNFYIDGNSYEIMIPPNYYDDGLEYEDLENLVLKDIIKKSGYKVQLAQVHQKLLAVRTGLGKYGKNNICYVDDWGSFISLYTYFTDYKFKEDNWKEINKMDICDSCNICINNCPTEAIPKSTNESFVIDAGKCVSLYNEIPGEIPNWIDPTAHNALIGCMRCQYKCPANKKALKNIVRFENISEKETKMILEGRSEDLLLDSLCKKLKMFYPSNAKEFFPVLCRNLNLLLL